MTTLNLVKRLTMPCLVASLFSCVKMPLDITLKDKIEISEQQVQEIAEDIFEKLSELDFNSPPPPGIPHTECSAAYKIWLRKQFDRGLVPKDIITAAEYGVSSSNPQIHACRYIDFEEEYKNAVGKSAGDEKRKRKAIIFGVSQFREKLISNKCTENFLDLDKEKITITGIELHVVENSLSVNAPRYKLYSSYEDDSLRDEIEGQTNAETKLVEDGTLMELGETRSIERRYVGPVAVDLNQSKDAFFEAEGPVVSLDGTLFAIPSSMASAPEITTVGGKEYFIVPTGKLALTLGTKLEVRFSTHDALCAFNRLKESIREVEAKHADKKSN